MSSFSTVHTSGRPLPMMNAAEVHPRRTTNILCPTIHRLPRRAGPLAELPVNNKPQGKHR